MAILFVCSSAYAANDCRGTYYKQARQMSNKLNDTNDGLILGMTGVAAGGMYGGFFTTATVFVPHMLAGAGLLYGVVHGTNYVKSVSINKMVKLIDDAYDYKNSGFKGKVLTKYVKRLKRNGLRDLNIDDLVANIIKGNEDKSLCMLYKNYAEYKKIKNIEQSIKCVISVPESTPDRVINSLQKKYDEQGIFITDNQSVNSDYSISHNTTVERHSISRNRDKRVEKDYFILTSNGDLIEEYFKRKRTKSIRKDRGMQYFNVNDNKNKLLKKIIKEVSYKCN
jgi:hypothetical protein